MRNNDGSPDMRYKSNQDAARVQGGLSFLFNWMAYPAAIPSGLIGMGLGYYSGFLGWDMLFACAFFGAAVGTILNIVLRPLWASRDPDPYDD